MRTSARSWPEPPEGFEVACDRVPQDGCYGPFLDLATGSPVYQRRSDERLVTIMVEATNGSWVCEIDSLDEHGEYAGTEACQPDCATPQEALDKAYEELERLFERSGKMHETENSRPIPSEVNMSPNNRVDANTRVPGAVEAEVAETCLGVHLEDPYLLSNDAFEAFQDLTKRAVGIASDGNAYWRSDFVLDDETMAPYVERILNEDGSLRLADDAPQREVR